VAAATAAAQVGRPELVANVGDVAVDGVGAEHEALLDPEGIEGDGQELIGVAEQGEVVVAVDRDEGRVRGSGREVADANGAVRAPAAAPSRWRAGFADGSATPWRQGAPR
jgi:hypothetical protein